MKRIMKKGTFFRLLIVCLLFAGIVFYSRDKDDTITIQQSDPTELSANLSGNNNTLPIAYTCDGVSAIFPMEWPGVPENIDREALLNVTEGIILTGTG